MHHLHHTPRRFLTVTTPAGDLSLLSIEQMRVAAGLDPSDGSQDADLAARGLAIAAGITSECRIAIGQGANPTLLQETLTETFYGVDVNELILARRHNVEIITATIDGAALVDSDRIVDPEAGMLTRLSDDCPRRWCARKVVVVYKAGFATVPPDLEQAALDYFRAVSMESDRDPYVKSESIEVPGVETITTDRWSGALAGTVSQSSIPGMVVGQLARFQNPGGF